MIDEAQKKSEAPNVVFRECPVEAFHSDERYDVILCTHAFPYFPDKEGTFQKMASLCVAGGQIILANSSTNSLKDLLINFGLKATTSKAKYLSIKQMKAIFAKAPVTLKQVKIIRERWYMPTIALFQLEGTL